MKIWSVEGNRQSLDGGAMFGNAPKAVWSKWISPDQSNRIELACRTLVIESGGKRVLFETGIGKFFEPKLAERYGVTQPEHMLLKNLAAAGIAESSLDFVVLSHLHFDHAGGLLPSYEDTAVHGPRLLFPNAKYVVGKEAWMRAKNPHPRDRASFIPGMTGMLEASGRLVIVEDETCAALPTGLREQISFFFTHGHTPGQMHSVINTGSKRIVFCGDLIPGLSWVHVPITMGYDRFPEQLIEEKEALYKKMPAGTLYFYTHDPMSAASEVAKSESGKWEPKNIIDSFSGAEQ